MNKKLIKPGMNSRNYDYWRNEVFIKLHQMNESVAGINASIVCQGQEIDKLKDRIIKIEKKI